MTSKRIDCSALQPYEGLHTAVSVAKDRGLHPYMIRVPPRWYAHLAICLNYHHEYIEEESVTYLVLRCPERVLVRTDEKVEYGNGLLLCNSPDVEIEFYLAQ